MNGERFTIYYAEKNLPGWLVNDHRGRLIISDDSVPVEKKGPWDYVLNFGHDLFPLTLSSGIDESRSTDPRVVCEENLAKRIISPFFRNITHLANLYDLKNPDVQTLYTANFVCGTRNTLRKGIDFAGSQAVVLAPMRGAKILKVMLEAMGISPNQMPNYQASRVSLRDGSYTIALRLDEPIPQGKSVIHVDDCGAALGTAYADLTVFEKLHRKPDKCAVVCGAGVRNSLDWYSKVLNKSGINFLIAVAAESNVMDKKYYLGLTEEEKRILNLPRQYAYRVADMGNAMLLDSEERQREIPLYQLLTITSEFDQAVRAITQNAIAQPGNLSRQAAIVRSFKH